MFKRKPRKEIEIVGEYEYHISNNEEEAEARINSDKIKLNLVLGFPLIIPKIRDEYPPKFKR